MNNELVSLLVRDMLEDIKHNRITLPTLPEVAYRIREIVDQPYATATMIADTLKLDSALSARLLKLANSPLFRARSAIEDINTAITRLGNANIRNLVTSIVLEQMYQGGYASSRIEQLLREQWKHTLRTAAISYYLTKHFTSLNADEAMMAGLIHDIGALPIIEYSESVPELSSSDQALELMISKLHAQIGRLILVKWRFPESLITVAANHEDIFRDPGIDLDYTDIVIIANLLSYIGTNHPATRLDWNTIPAFNRLAISPEESIDAIKNAHEEIAQIQRIFS